ncbi:type III-A CRISPR-associated protein Cas10/Csm1 [Caldicellulosiruptor morganii]|uniref:CRISPR system single-strand-specific deoxyribonuclease Cas10/Csm1 (subtype III-A) n=1 Tax=Caldicellulosiruptor morganii TaxID=1387555 RepID=A0ABY7BQS6_9FIRM|nr:type III-A CRISPR-associated protein Cas10/Csm1 [Caldicellulosiruptor morganii]WAM33891.1 type III-A CRISPR-associated protein Cas10/Csm1 [Caldicellulosiruptor morganii]
MVFYNTGLSKADRESDYQLFLGSILHDIGKFYMRTANKDAKETIKKEYETLYKEEGADLPRHQEWGAFFAENTVPSFFQVTSHIRNHHRPSNYKELLIAVADRISSATDREEIEEESPKVKQMISIFSNISLSSNESAAEAQNITYKHLTKKYKITFPEDMPKSDVSNDYGKLWQEFAEKMKKLKDDFEKGLIDVEEYLTAVYNLMQQYTYNIPSAFYYSKPDISLWAHSKSTAAIAFCLDRELKARFNGDQGRITRELESLLTKIKNKSSIKKGDGELFCLVKGDVSGIQDFVFDTKIDGALKALKGKSFYISFLLDTIAKFILKEENMPVCNLIYNGGGHFYLLLPRSFEERLSHYQSLIDSIMFKAHKGALNVFIESSSIDLFTFMNDRIGEKFDEVARKIQVKKTKKFKDILKNNQMKFFEPYDDYNEKCPHCGNQVSINSEGKEVCSFCESFVELGERLIKSLYVIEKWDIKPAKENLNNIYNILNAFGREIKFSQQHGRISDTIIIDMLKIEEMNKEGNFDPEFYEALDISTYAPIEEEKDGQEHIKLLDDIVNESKGIKTWGIVRGDVDNLGRIFKEGLKGKISLSRVMTLSQEFSLFFGYFFNRLTKAKSLNSIVIYAGGDDFCVLGPWTDMPYLAHEVYKAFRSYVGGNEYVTVSMGFEISPDKKYPIYRVATVCGEHLDEAKKFERKNGKKKDCFAFGGHFVGWEDFENLKDIKEQIVDLVENKNVSKAIINAIYTVDKLGRTSKENKEIFKSWRFVYYIAKLKDRYKKLKDQLDAILFTIINQKTNTLYDHAYLAARWAELELRK